MLWAFIASVTIIMAGYVDQAPPRVGAAVADESPVGDTPFQRFRTVDGLEREITFYITRPPSESGDLPLAVYVHGSGCQSIFAERNGRVYAGSGAGPIERAMRGKARLVLVEKPGVHYLDAPARPGGTEGASEEFLREHTLDRWSEAVSAVIDAAAGLDGVDESRVLVFGHSEGGLVACRVAAMNERVTHVGCLAGGGATQLFDLMELARRGDFYGHVSEDPERRVVALVEDWKRVLEDPDSTEKRFLGHPYRRWSSFLKSSPMQELLKTDASVFIAQGVADTAVCVESFDALHATLLAHGRDVTARRIEGADHSFATEGEQPGEGWTQVMDDITRWFTAGTNRDEASVR